MHWTKYDVLTSNGFQYICNVVSKSLRRCRHTLYAYVSLFMTFVEGETKTKN